MPMPSVDMTRQAIQAVLSTRFPLAELPAVPHKLGHASSRCLSATVCMEDVVAATVSLADMALLRHQSQHEDDRNRDPDVEQLLKCAPHLARTAATPHNADGYARTEHVKRALPNRFPARGPSVKKPRLRGAANPHGHAPAPLAATPRGTPAPANPQSLAGGASAHGLTLPVPGISVTMSMPRAKTVSQVKRDARRRTLQLQDRARKAEEFKSNGGVDAAHFRTSTSGWQGTNFSSTLEGKELIRQWHDYSILLRLKEFHRVRYAGLKTRIRDSAGRLWLLRTFVGHRIDALLPAFEEQVAAFVNSVERNKSGFSISDMENNARGPRWFSLCGHDRNSKSTLPQRLALLKCTGRRCPVDARGRCLSDKASHMSPPLSLSLTHISILMNAVFEAEFPLLAKRYSDCAKTLGIHPLYGHFFNFCLNSPRGWVKRVHCSPHVDFKNIAIGVCVLFVYGNFNSKERSWLVIWEAGLVLEVPAGVFVMYPSSLFFHFNVDMCDIELVCTHGELPTPENSSSLDGGDGRGSCVWFNQASMFQTAELGFATVAEARAAGAPCNSSPSSLIDQGLFPRA
ncbi:hypothetical protein EV702DRAFT_1202763 [Suillus placidus]|uniref:Uncharacterized protein n=1 Tax=Suillus placidus TaxID=48579 RepID=A0A9P6ZKA3_9AGAM|nr:hypothetical protein EV702DRAFT_1202763 [Suillus placidus]